MINDDVYEKIYKMFSEDDFVGIYKIKDIGDSWVFFGGNPNEVYYGIRTISCNKSDGKIEWFFPNVEGNRDLLNKGKELEVPEKYRYKAS